MADLEERGAGRGEPSRRPTEAEAWAAFWDCLAELYLSLPPDAQRRLAEDGSGGPEAS